MDKGHGGCEILEERNNRKGASRGLGSVGRERRDICVISFS